MRITMPALSRTPAGFAPGAAASAWPKDVASDSEGLGGTGSGSVVRPVASNATKNNWSNSLQSVQPGAPRPARSNGSGAVPKRTLESPNQNAPGELGTGDWIWIAKVWLPT